MFFGVECVDVSVGGYGDAYAARVCSCLCIVYEPQRDLLCRIGLCALDIYCFSAAAARFVTCPASAIAPGSSKDEFRGEGFRIQLSLHLC